MSASTATATLPEVVAPPLVPRRHLRWRPDRKPIEKAIFIVLLIGATVLFLYPFVWIVSASFKPRAQVFDNRLIPLNWAPGNYVQIWHAAPVLHWAINSIYIAVLAAGTVTISSALVAFGFAYFRFPGRNVFFGCVLATMMLPSAVTLVPVYLIWDHLGLATTQFPLWMQNLTGSAFYIFLQRQFFLGIPRDLFEASRMDGDNYWTMFWRIAVPLAKPALIVTFIFEFQASWTNLLQPLIYLRSESQWTLSVGLYQLLNIFGPDGPSPGQWQLIIAGLVISTIPMIIVFFLGQRYFVEGIATQGGKG
ncbi:MAG: ABC-type transporter, integral rane subunit [Acidimicrobiaceae bacterium]|nr:ABC-type transporter, integral rane subunit [Acidimicrobiaceae bacterium]